MTNELGGVGSAPAVRNDVQPALAPTHDVLQLALHGAAVLLANGETTERTIAAGMRIAAAYERRAIVLPPMGRAHGPR